MSHLKNIRNIGAIIYFFLVQLPVCTSQPVPIDSGDVIKILPLHKKQYIFTKHHIAVMKKNKPVFLSGIESEIQDAVAHNGTLWIGTDKGLYTYAITTGVTQRSAMLSDDVNISRVRIDGEGSLWIASINKGLWRIKENKTEKLLDIAPIYSLAISNDGNVWAGSNIGLYKLDKKTNSWQRYAEEGYSGYEIPDNIVENLFCDAHNNLWVIMPDQFAFIQDRADDGHIPGFRNMVTQDFELKFIMEIAKSHYIFVTSKGIFLMPNTPAAHSHKEQEIKTGPDQKMYLLTNKQLLLDHSLDTKYIRAAGADHSGNLLLAYNNNMYCIKNKTIKNLIKINP